MAGPFRPGGRAFFNWRWFEGGRRRTPTGYVAGGPTDDEICNFAAAYTAASQVWTYIQMPGMAIGASVSSMAAQNVGAGRWDRVDRIAMSGLASSVVITGSIAVLIYALGPLPLYIFLPVGSPVARGWMSSESRC